MHTFRRMVNSLLLGILSLVLFVSPARADYAAWSYVAQIDGVYCVGRLGIGQFGTGEKALSEIHSGYLTNNTWTSVNLPAGWLYTYLQMYASSGEVLGFGSAYNVNEDDSVYVLGHVSGINGIAYVATGGGNIYNWHSGSRISGTYASAAHTFHASRGSSSSIIDNALSCADEYAARTQRYPQTADGETYGSILYERQLGRPDWISACATNGEHGYIDADDYWVPTALNPADAVANFSVQRVRTIPVYDEPGGTTVVGYFDMYYGGGSD